MKRRELAEKLLQHLDDDIEKDEKFTWLEAFCNEIVDSYWMNHYTTRVSDPNTGFSYPVCGLCGNNGVIHSKCFTPAGIPIDTKVFCICPNGQGLRKLGRDPTLSYCPDEKTINKQP